MIRSWYNSLGITHKLRLGLTIVALIAILSFGSIYTYLGVISLQSSIIASTENTANIMGSSLVASIRFEKPEFAKDKLKTLTPDESYKSVCIFKVTGEPFTSYPDDTTCVPLKVLWNGTFQDNLLDLADTSTVTRNIWSDGQVVGAIEITRSKIAINEYLAIQLKTMALIASGCLAFCYIIGGYLQKAITRPIVDIATSAELISIMHNFDQRLNQNSNDEIGQVARAFNTVVSFMNERNKELLLAYNNIRKAHHLTLQRIGEITEEFSVPVDAFELYTQNKGYITDMDDSFTQQQALLESINEHHIKLNSVARISSIYAQSIQEKLLPIGLKEYTAKYQNRLTSMMPGIPIEILGGLQNSAEKPSLEVYKTSWDELFRLISELVLCMSEIVAFPIKIQCSLQVNTSELVIALVNQRSTFVSGGMHLLDLSKTGSSEDGSSYVYYTIDDPDAANEFLDDDSLPRRDAKFMLETMKYIANANSILCRHQFSDDCFIVYLRLKNLSYADSPSDYIKVCQ